MPLRSASLPIPALATLSSYNDTQIVANVTVPANWAGVINVTVTSNGYNGQGFQSNGNGQSAQSSGSNVGIYTVWNHAEITIVGWVNGGAVTLPSGANSILINNLNSVYGCAADVSAWALGRHSDVQSAADFAYANAFLVKNSAKLR